LQKHESLKTLSEIQEYCQNFESAKNDAITNADN